MTDIEKAAEHIRDCTDARERLGLDDDICAPEPAPLHVGADNGVQVSEETLFPEPPHVRVRIENALTRMQWLSTLFAPCPVQCEPFCTIAQAAVGVLEHARKRLELVEKLTEDGAPYDQFYNDLLDLRSNLRSAIRYLELAEQAGA